MLACGSILILALLESIPFPLISGILALIKDKHFIPQKTKTGKTLFYVLIPFTME